MITDEIVEKAEDAFAEIAGEYVYLPGLRAALDAVYPLIAAKVSGEAVTRADIFRSALLDIKAAYVPDQPATSQADEISWIMQHVGAIRRIAVRALDEAATHVSSFREPPLRLCGFCQTWNSKPCGEQCAWLPTDPLYTQPPSALSKPNTR